MASTSKLWPALPLARWQDTYATLHMWTQIVGKTRLALAPMVNHWWNVTLYVTARGLSTAVMPHRQRAFEVEFDFLDHVLALRTSDGATRTLPLAARPVADFYAEYLGAVEALGLEHRIHPVPVEIPEAIPFALDRKHSAYDASAARDFFQALLQADRLLKGFRGHFAGKCSPVHFFWGGFDLACTRFSGRPAPPYGGTIPNCPDYVMLEAYSHECISAGWWPGSGAVSEPAFYAYAYPEPAGLAQASIRPAAARYDTTMREFILPYEAVRTAQNPDEAVLAFLQSTYDAAADLAGWDRAALDRRR